MQIDEDLKEFLIEGYENLNQIESDLVLLEQSNADPEVMNRIYRSLHTIKGNSGFLGLEKLGSVAHAGENLLSRLRDRTIQINPDITSALLEVIDSVRQHFEALEATGEESSIDETALLAKLIQLQESSGLAIAPSPPNAIAPPGQPQGDFPYSPHSGATTGGLPLQPPLPHSPTPEFADTDINQFSVADTAIRVDVNLLDKLMNLVGELVLCRNQILEFANTQTVNEQNDNAFKSVSGRLNLVTSELQEGVMKTRMQPIRTIWNKFPRVVRDIALNLGKQVRLEMEGEETELDKTLIEAIANPLTHLVRNCLDHGLETPEVRTAAGKPALGRLFLRAYHESGHVNIEVSDDGGGIDPERIKQKALQRGMITPDQAAQMGDQEALNLIFLPSFSTAETITNISGRGVGMDVVRTNIEKISGTIDVQSRIGQGTKFKLKIPLTLAIIPTLIITTGGDRYAIPQVNLVELLRLEGEQAKQRIEMFHETPVYRLRGRLLPLVYLNRELKLDEEDEEDKEDKEQSKIQNPLAQRRVALSKIDEDVLNIVVVQATDKPFGLVVDTINDTQEIVVKPLGKQLKSIPCFAGATIMGDGKVALILDVQGIAQSTHILSKEEKAIALEETRQKNSSEEPEQLLLFQGPDCRRMAIPLANVCRLEEISPALLERVGKHDAIQYRNQIMPLIYLADVFGSDRNRRNSSLDSSLLSDEKLPVIVVSMDGEKQVGLVVERILDIVEQMIEVKGAATQEGIQYCAVIQERVAEIIDIEIVISNNLFGSKQMLVGTR